MGHLRGAIRTLAVRGLSPEQIVDELRADWNVLGFTRTATIIVGLYDPATSQLKMASAGHPPPLLLSAWGADYVPISPNPLLGIKAGAPATSHVASLDQGDVLLLYTDGALGNVHGELTMPWRCSLNWRLRASDLRKASASRLLKLPMMEMTTPHFWPSCVLCTTTGS